MRRARSPAGNTISPMPQSHPSREPLRPARRQIWLGIIVIILAGFVAYYGDNLDAPFFFDDIPGVVQNESIRNLVDLRRVLHPPAEGAGIDSRPVINLSLAINYAAGGLHPRGYRLTNIALHVLGALALFGLVRRTLTLPSVPERWRGTALPAAFCTALLWTVHPLQSETVICVIQRTESFVSLWYLLMLYCFVRAAEPGGDRRWLCAAWAACLLGMASKEVMVSAPLMVFLFDRTFLAGTFREAWRRRGRWHAAFAATWLLLAWLVLDSGGDRGGTAGFGHGVSAWTYLLTQARALTLYLKLSVWPHPLILDYGDWVARGLGAVFWEALLILALLGLTVWAVVRRPGTGFVGAFFFAVLAPSSSFYPLISQTIAEHRMHLPLAAVLTLLVLGLFRLPGRVALTLGLAAALAAGWGTVRRGADYADELTLWTDLVEKTPSSAWARIHLGWYHFRSGRFAEALPQYQAAAALKPGQHAPHFHLALTLEALHRPAEAMERYRRALALKPADAESHLRLGLLLLRAGLTDEALPSLMEAVRLRPDHTDAVGNLGAALYQLGRVNDALPHFERVLGLKPDSVEARYNLALLFLQSGRPHDALPHLEEAAALRPEDAEIQSTLRRTRALLD